MRRGSALEITAPASIVSPEASATPVARRSFTRICATSAPVLISAPASLAAAAIAWVTAPIPPFGKRVGPAGLPSPAARIKSIRAVPADQGPRKAPNVPRAAIVARSSSVSKNSATRSAIAIGPQRRTWYISFLPGPAGRGRP